MTRRIDSIHQAPTPQQPMQSKHQNTLSQTTTDKDEREQLRKDIFALNEILKSLATNTLRTQDNDTDQLASSVLNKLNAKVNAL